MELTNFNSEKMYSSKFLVEQINHFRKAEGNETELLHKNLIVKIEEEFAEEIGGLKIQPTSYTDASNRQSKCYELNFEQSIQLLMSESKTVRKACVIVMKEQQKVIQQIETPSYQIEDQIERAKKWIIEEEERRQLKIESAQTKQEVTVLKAKIEEDADAVDFAAAAMLADNFMPLELGIASMNLQLNRNQIYDILRECGILQKSKSKILPIRKYLEFENQQTGQKGLGWFRETLEVYQTSEGRNIASQKVSICTLGIDECRKTVQEWFKNNPPKVRH